jgi:hypothetical protein
METAAQVPPSWPPSPVIPTASSLRTTAQGRAPSWPRPVMLAASSMETTTQGLAMAIGKTRSNRDVCVCMHFFLVEEAVRRKPRAQKGAGYLASEAKKRAAIMPRSANELRAW